MSATPIVPTTDAVVTAPQTTAPKKAKAPKEPSRANWLVRGVLTVVVIGFLIPTFGLLVTSFRTRDDALETGWWTALFNPFGSDWILSNYTEVLSQGMGNAFVNSLAVTIPATVIPILIAAMAAYAFTFTEFRGRDTLFVVVVGLLVIPNQVALVPLLQMFGALNLIGEFPSVWLAHAGFGMPLAIFILRAYMATLPKAVIESAKIDGASHYQTFWRLILPMSVPALASFAIFQFLWVWNDLLIALLFLGGGDNEVVTQNLASLLGQYGDRWDLLAPGAFVTMALPLTVFIALQRYFVRGMTAGAVKG
ncbi:carbohydrate ABC transporter permease [Actinotalea sp.]|uniref:carbohydrate ABC transporter permease n=1 Tax=Actinotalea sp. TaxID=1872145 RepID=UPI002C67E57A|nr:carbohydrate ABC transporter permease [Actinotalea sp.]HQY34811.1 carbohydrate ABC transporter permease [Actinotalea sp.]HRA50238.1 carbohydrate ABC transporter permease [Actinotalea sp.]